MTVAGKEPFQIEPIYSQRSPEMMSAGRQYKQLQNFHLHLQLNWKQCKCFVMTANEVVTSVTWQEQILCQRCAVTKSVPWAPPKTKGPYTFFYHPWRPEFKSYLGSQEVSLVSHLNLFICKYLTAKPILWLAQFGRTWTAEDMVRLAWCPFDKAVWLFSGLE